MSDETTPESDVVKVGGFALSELTDTQLSALADRLKTQIMDGAKTVTTGDELAALKAVRAEFDAVTAESSTRAEATKVDPAEVEALTDLPDPTPAAVLVEVSDTAEVEQTDAVETPAAETLVMAAAGKILENGVDTGQSATEQDAPASVNDTRPRFASAMPFRQSGGAGTVMGSDTTIGDTIRAIASRHVSPTNGDVVLATARLDSDPERVLSDSPGRNEAIIARNLGDLRERRRSERNPSAAARIAAICDPATILRDFRAAGTDATPVSDAFSWLTGESGNALKYEFRLPASLADASAGVAEWTETLQGDIDAADSDTWKPVATITCPDYTTVEASELTAGWEVDSFTELSSPEVVTEFENKIKQLQARFREGWLLREITDLAIDYTYGPIEGAVADVVAAIEWTLYTATYAERLDPADYVAILPPNLTNLLVVDDVRRGNHTDPLKSAADLIAEVEHATGVTVVQSLDLPITSGGALPTNPYGAPTVGAYEAAIPTPWSPASGDPTTFAIKLVDPSSFQPFTTGEAVFGQAITLDQARQNKRGLFMREFVGLMKPGIANAYSVKLTLRPNGGRSGLITADAATAK